MIGDQSDIVARLKALLPLAWFKGDTPILDGTLGGIASALSIATATDGFLDLISYDFFGGMLPRKAGELDASFRPRIRAALLPERGTRRGMIRALTLLTGRAPAIFEPAQTGDTGAYNNGTMGYNVAGGYGSLALPKQSFLIAYRPIGEGIANVSGYGDPQGAYNAASQLIYTNSSMVNGITDADIYATIDATKPLNAIVWTQIKS